MIKLANKNILNINTRTLHFIIFLVNSNFQTRVSYYIKRTIFTLYYKKMYYTKRTIFLSVVHRYITPIYLFRAKKIGDMT